MAVSDIKGAIIRKTRSHFLLFFLNESTLGIINRILPLARKQNWVRNRDQYILMGNRELCWVFYTFLSYFIPSFSVILCYERHRVCETH